MAKAKSEGPPLQRLVALERENRRLRRLAIGLAVLVVVALVTATAALVAPYNAWLGFHLGEVLGRPEVVETKKTIVEAEQFVLRGPDGKVRATLALRDGNTAGLDLYDADGRGRAGFHLAGEGQPNLWMATADGNVTLSANGQGVRIGDGAAGTNFLSAAGLSLVDANRKNRLALLLKDDDATSLTLYDREGRPGALVDVSPDGARLGLFYDGVVRAGIGHRRGGSQLNLFGEDGTDHVTLSLMADGSAGLLFHDGQGKQRLSLGVLPTDVAGLSIYDKTEKHRAGLSVVGDGSPHFELFDGAGVRRAGLALTPDGLPGLLLEDRGQPRAILGFGPNPDGQRPTLSGRSPSTSSLLLFDRDGSLIFQAPVY
jgi:hypothetical protein